jgi:two-component system cell cycle sensor histidine kinase/response regulator CckA
MSFASVISLVAAGTGLLVLAAVIVRQGQTLARLHQEIATLNDSLLASRRRGELLFSSNPHPMWIYDRQTLRFLDVNEAAVRGYGYPREEFLKMSVVDIRPPEDASAFTEFISHLPEGYRRPGVWRHLRKDGTLMRVEIAAFKFEIDGHLAELVVAQDITERCCVEEALRNSEASLKALLDNAPLGIAEGALDKSYLSMTNPALREILGGYSVEEALVLDLNAQVYADVKERERLLEVLRRSGKITGWETNIRRRDGTPVPVRITAVLAPGEPERLLSYIEDTTQQNALEQQVRQVQKLEAVGRLAGGMAHDFNNVLVVIKLSTEMMLAQITPDSPFSKPLLQISNAAERAAALTRQMLAFGRQQMMQPRIINVNAVVSDTAHMLRQVIGEDIELVTELEESVQNAKLDPDQLTQVILNLAVNARDAMPNGGTLHIETATRTLDEAYAREHQPVQPGRYVMMSVSDTGSGIDRSVLPRIFDPFFTTKEIGKGTGLGLSIVYGIVKQSGGYIWVYSEPGHGTTFKLYFPATTAPLDPPDARRDIPGRPAGQLILVVEDEATIRSNVRDCLSQLGYRVVVADTANAALRRCDQLEGKIDLLLTDVVMAGKSGYDLALELSGRYPSIPVLFMSGYTEDSGVRRELLLKGSPFLQKPFSVADLASAVHAALLMRAVHT